MGGFLYIDCSSPHTQPSPNSDSTLDRMNISITNSLFTFNMADRGRDLFLLCSSAQHQLSHSIFHNLLLSSNDSNSFVTYSTLDSSYTFDLLQFSASSSKETQSVSGRVIAIIIISFILFLLLVAFTFLLITLCLLPPPGQQKIQHSSSRIYEMTTFHTASTIDISEKEWTKLDCGYSILSSSNHIASFPFSLLLCRSATSCTPSPSPIFSLPPSLSLTVLQLTKSYYVKDWSVNHPVSVIDGFYSVFSALLSPYMRFFLSLSPSQLWLSSSLE